MFLLYTLSLGAPIWSIGVGGPRVRPVRTHSSYAPGGGGGGGGGGEGRATTFDGRQPPSPLLAKKRRISSGGAIILAPLAIVCVNRDC
jgi:hypothetical protein